jgi:hypothetical protein
MVDPSAGRLAAGRLRRAAALRLGLGVLGLWKAIRSRWSFLRRA